MNQTISTSESVLFKGRVTLMKFTCYRISILIKSKQKNQTISTSESKLLPFKGSITLMKFTCYRTNIFTKSKSAINESNHFNQRVSSFSKEALLSKEGVSERHTHKGLTLMSHREVNSEITVSSLLPLNCVAFYLLPALSN